MSDIGPHETELLLVFDLPSSLKERLEEAATNCYESINYRPSPGALGYHVTVMPPFPWHADGTLSFIAEFEALPLRHTPVFMPTALGRFEEPEHVLYFGGFESNLIDRFNQMRYDCRRRELDPSEHLLPHCTLAKGVPPTLNEMLLDEIQPFFENVRFPEVLMLDTLVLYERRDGRWQETGRVQLLPSD